MFSAVHPWVLGQSVSPSPVTDIMLEQINLIPCQSNISNMSNLEKLITDFQTSHRNHQEQENNKMRSCGSVTDPIYHKCRHTSTIFSLDNLIRIIVLHIFFSKVENTKIVTLNMKMSLSISPYND